MTRYGMTTPYEIMTPSAATCPLDTSFRDAGYATAGEDCGPITVVVESGEPAGVVTDHDTTVRVAACGRTPLEATASETFSEVAGAVWADYVPAE